MMDRAKGDLTHVEIVALLRQLQYGTIRNKEGQILIRARLRDLEQEMVHLHTRLDAVMDLIVA